MRSRTLTGAHTCSIPNETCAVKGMRIWLGSLVGSMECLPYCFRYSKAHIAIDVCNTPSVA